jgi:hypothetical protein
MKKPRLIEYNVIEDINRKGRNISQIYVETTMKVVGIEYDSNEIVENTSEELFEEVKRKIKEEESFDNELIRKIEQTS